MNRTIYHISPLRLWVLPAMLLLFAGFIMSLAISDTGNPETRRVAVGTGIFFLIFAGVMFLILQRTRLEFSDEGVKLFQFGYLLETDWDNVSHLYDAPGTEGIVLHRAMVCAGARTLYNHRNTQIKGVNSYTPEQIEALGELRLIPIEAFGYKLKDGLRDELIRRSPSIRANQNHG